MDKITFKHFKLNLIAQPYFVWHELKKESDDDFDEDNFWDQDFDLVETPESQVIAQTFSKIVSKATDILLKQGGIVISGTDDLKIEETKKHFGSKDLVINPVFEYKGALAKPLAYDFSTNTIIDVKFSKKTKRIDFMKGFYNYEIISKNGINVNDYLLYLPADVKGKKGEINLTSTNRINLTKGGDVYDATDKDGNLKAQPFMQSISTQEEFVLKSIDLYIDEINAAREVKDISSNLSKDLTEFGENPFWNELLEKLENEYAGVNGKVVSKKSIVENDIKSNAVLEAYRELTKTEILDADEVNKLMLKINNSDRVIWYDFEGYSLPFPAVDDTKPYQQMVFQVSKIETDGQANEVSSSNLVWDPKSLSADQLFEVIENVYSNKADKYVVYNRGYEIARMKEIRDLLYGNNKYDDACLMWDHIEANTIDLMDLFKINSGNKIPPILMNDQKCKASIKNIEKHISSNNIKVGFDIKEYKSLDVQNGGQAMDIAIRRAIGVMGDNEWNEKVSGLKTYCENDVRMMIMVFHFIKWLQK